MTDNAAPNDSEIVQQLRQRAKFTADVSSERVAALDTWAADLIEAQVAELGRLKEMLRPGSPTERAPTTWAYGKACEALDKHRELARTQDRRAAGAEQCLAALLMANDGVAALLSAGRERLCKQQGERDTEFVKRIARAFNRALFAQMSAEAYGSVQNQPLVFAYTNWRGEDGVRRVQPIRLYFGSTQWHPEPQWLLEAVDIGKGEVRAFAWKDMRPASPSGKDQAP